MRALPLMVALLSLAGCPGGAARQGTLPPLPLKGSWHQVEAEETVATLASRYKVAAADIEEINGLDKGQIPAVGDRIFIPGAVSWSGDGEKTWSRSGAPAPAPAPAAATGGTLLWPVPGGALSSKFGTRGERPHEGIDIRAPRGTAILAAADGTVMYAGDGVRGYGNMIIIRHAGGLVTVYAHNQRNHAAEGVKVTRGQVIGEVGSSGRASGTHLHFEVRRGESPEDPLPHLKLP